jgi:hypothetical protein
MIFVSENSIYKTVDGYKGLFAFTIYTNLIVNHLSKLY